MSYEKVQMQDAVSPPPAYGGEVPPQGGYPQAGYPQAGYPQPGYPQQGYPPAGPQQAGYPPPQQYGAQTVVVAPAAQAIDRNGEPIKDNMVMAVISIFFCCILGIIATVKANNSKEALRVGRIDDAASDSILARKLAIAAFVIGAICLALSIFFTVILPLIAGAAIVGVGMSETSDVGSGY